MQRRTALIASTLAVLVATMPSARAAEAQAVTRCAVLSFIGDELGMVGYQPSLGTRFDRNLKSSVPLPQAGFDAVALRAVQEAAKARGGKPETLLYRASSPRLAKDPSQLFDGDKARLPPAFEAAMKEDAATHALIVTRRRSEAIFQATYSASGGGQIEGIGFFADTEKEMINLDTKYSSVGYLAPYVALQLTLVDLGTGMVVRRKNVYETRVIAAASGNDSANPWQLLDVTQKVTLINELIDAGVRKALPLVLDGEPG